MGHKTIKYIMWTLTCTLNWLHNDMHCCHLDLNLENIMLQNAEFITNKIDGSITINPNITPKLCDFGRSELFAMKGGDMFQCDKPSMSMYAKNGVYDARSADIFDLGMVLCHCFVGFNGSTPDINECGSLHDAVLNGTLKRYLSMNSMKKKLGDKRISDLLTKLLFVGKSIRYKTKYILRHQWFKTYYKRYNEMISRHSESQKIKLMKQTQILSIFPYYILTHPNL